jgi:hypothetical protein
MEKRRQATIELAALELRAEQSEGASSEGTSSSEASGAESARAAAAESLRLKVAHHNAEIDKLQSRLMRNEGWEASAEKKVRIILT